MDIAENGLRAGATLIGITVIEDKENRIKITIQDNGHGIPDKMFQQIMNPYFTARTTGHGGQGLHLFRKSSKRSNGEFSINSKEGKGTRICATFRRDHAGLPPFGDMAGSMTGLMTGNSDVDFVYTHERDGNIFELDTRKIKDELEGAPIDHPEVLRYLGSAIRNAFSEM